MIYLTIIVPHWNSPDLLKYLLSSIPDLKDIEIIIIDDNSDLKKEEYCQIKKTYESNRILFLSNTSQNKGAGTCRNIGLKRARGKWILFADSDDIFEKGFYEKIVNYFESKLDVVFFTPTSIELGTNKKSDRHLPYKGLIEDYLNNKTLRSETLLRYQFSVPWSKLIKREFLVKHEIIFDEVIAANDVMFSTLTGYYMTNFEATNEIIYCVTRSAGTLTMNNDKRIYYARLDVHIRYFNFIRESLPKEESKYIYTNGLGILLDGIKYSLSIKQLLLVYLCLKKNKIGIFNRKLINPMFFLKKFNSRLKKILENRKFK